MQLTLPLLAYIGPETIVPLTSLLAVIGGVLLCGWHWVCAACQRCYRSALGRPEDNVLVPSSAGGSSSEESPESPTASLNRAGD
jgi:hypothetical protein